MSGKDLSLQYDGDAARMHVDITDEVACSDHLRRAIEEQRNRVDELETRFHQQTAELEDVVTYMTTVFENTYDGIGIVDEQGRFERGNPASFRIIGWPEEELIGEFFLKVFPPEWHAFMIERWAEVQRGDGRPYETQTWTKEGNRRDLLLSHRHMTIGGKRKYAVVVTDITKLKRAQTELRDWGNNLEQRVAERTAELSASNTRLRKSEETLARAQAIAQIGSFEWCPVHGHLDWSAEMRRMHGLDADKPLPKDLEKLRRTMYPDDIPRVQQAIDRTVSAGVPLRIAYRLIGEKGAVRYVLAHGERRPCERDPSVMMMVGTLQDITEQRRLEQQIVQASQREQERIGTDLHDSLGQDLAALSLFASTLTAEIDKCCPKLAPQAAQVAEFARNAVQRSRILAHGMAPVDIKIGGLEIELQQMASDAVALYGVDVRFTAESAEIVHGVERTTHLYYIAKEAVSNALRHGHPTRVEICLSMTADKGRLVVADNGTWSDGKRESGIAIRIMHLRADLIDGTFFIEENSPKGRRVICDFPHSPSFGSDDTPYAADR